ncbi:MAG: sigma factor [Ruthenibacterium lactatiformans]|uniref:sigma factor n=1 Tax=Ruthenibacterium lactatiformans TaxID=1550024 RepID=UPI00399403D5
MLAAAQLVSQNEGYLTVLARSCCEPFSQHSLEEDLKQEGAMALLSAAGRFDFDAGTKLLTFATPIVQTAMLDCAAKVFRPAASAQPLLSAASNSFPLCSSRTGCGTRSSNEDSGQIECLWPYRQAFAGRIPYGIPN